MPKQTPTNMVVTNCMVVDGVTDTPRAAAVWVSGDRIKTIGPVEEPFRRDGRRPPGQRRCHRSRWCACDGRTDKNAHHLSLSLPGPIGDEVQQMGPHGLAFYMADGGRRTLEEGVTTVRCVAEKDGADFALRAAIDQGRVPGPRMKTAGRALVCTGGHGHEGSDTLQCDGADGFRRGVRQQVSQGADLIKVMISGGIAGQHEKISTPQLAGDELDAVISTAHDWGRKVTAHAGPAAVITAAVERGLDCVEHGYQLTPEVAKLMAERGTALVPTLVVTRCGDFFQQLGIPDWMQERSLSAGPQHLDSYQMALDAGVEIMLGSDMPPFWPFEGTTATVRELEHLADGGLGPMAALRAATLTPARWLDVDDDRGTVEFGSTPISWRWTAIRAATPRPGGRSAGS